MITNNSLKKKISLCFLGTTLWFFPFADDVYAAPNNVSITEENQQESPNTIVERIQNILNSTQTSPMINNSAKGFNSSANTNFKSINAAPKSVQIEQDSPDFDEVPDAESAEQEQHLNDPGHYDFDWQGTPIASSLYAVAKVADMDVVVNAELKGTVYVSLHNVTCEQAMDYLSRSFDFNWMVEGNAIIISKDDIMRQSKTFAVHHVSDMEKLANEIEALGIDKKYIFANTESRSISVTATPYQLTQAARRIALIDKPVAQCLILAQLIEVAHGKSLDLGMKYELPTYSHTGTSSGYTNSDSFHGNWLEKLTFSASASASRSLDNGRVVSRPMVMVMNGQQGTVNFGDRVPILKTTTTTASTDITVDYQEVGTKLVITPAIDQASSTITMNIEAEVSNISKWIISGQTRAPQISSRKAVTSAHLRSGQSFVIGGLMSVTDLDNLSGIPGLMDLPILGKIFSFHSKSKTYSEIFIMITPYIVTDDIDPQALLRKAGADDIGK